ncbi:MAG TPA: hypothetical protein PKA10_14015 [Selenomonadales bacterium]|nr:hypothetical protein [Selenomonadales bacterium]
MAKTIEEKYMTQLDKMVNSYLSSPQTYLKNLTMDNIQESYLGRSFYFCMSNYHGQDIKYILSNYNRKIPNEQDVSSDYFISSQEKEDQLTAKQEDKIGALDEQEHRIVKETDEEETDIIFSLPCDMQYIRQERQKEMETIIVRIQEILKPQEYEILLARYLNEKPLREIARQLSTNHMKIQRILKHIATKLNVLRNAVTEVLQMEAEYHNNDGFTYLGWPFDLYSRVGKGGYWHKGSYHWNKTECRLPEYLEQCFSDDKTACDMCAYLDGESLCKRKDYYSKKNSVTKWFANGIIGEGIA